MDSWEDEDVDEISIPVASGAPASWEDEEDETLIEQAAAAAAGKLFIFSREIPFGVTIC